MNMHPPPSPWNLTRQRPGMTDLSHLSSEAGAETLLPNPERILRIRAERWINYGCAERVLARMAELLEYPQRDRMPCFLLFGATVMGKTKILRKFLRDHPPVFDDRMGVTRSQVVSMQMPPDPDEKAFYEELLGTLQAPIRFVGEDPLPPSRSSGATWLRRHTHDHNRRSPRVVSWIIPPAKNFVEHAAVFGNRS